MALNAGQTFDFNMGSGGAAVPSLDVPLDDLIKKVRATEKKTLTASLSNLIIITLFAVCFGPV